ncbi:MAG: AAA family ATPase [Acidobacteriota bacterium]
MLRTIIISPDVALADRLGQTLGTFKDEVKVCRVIEGYPSTVELGRTLRAHAPEVIFLNFEDVALAVETVRFLEGYGTGLQIVAIHRVCDAGLLRETMRAGVREFLTEPFDDQAVVEALRNIKTLLSKKPPVYESTNQILTFVPSKAGVGTTTLALNISAAMTKSNKESSVLLTDLDLNSGMLRFLLKLNNDYCVVDAVENSGQMDENMWPQLVSSKGGLDILHAGRVNPNLRIEPSQIQGLLQFMRRNYEALVFDVSGNLERYSIEVMQESKRIFVVCTPEIPSLHLAREKMGFLKTLGLDTRVSLLLNRVSKKPLFTAQQVEELVGAKVVYSFSNDYFAVSRATTGGQCLEPESVIGKQCAEFAATLMERRPPAASPDRRKKFLEYFNVGNGTQMASSEKA